MDTSQLNRVQNRVIFTGFSILTLLAAILVASTVAPPGGECEARFIQELFTCFHEFNVSFNTYLWAAGNKTGGVPPDNETAFKQQMCSVENDVVQCVLDSLHALVDTAACGSSAEGMHSLLTVQVRTVFEEYDNYCAHDCRQSLEKDMKQCYSDLGLDSSLFLSTTNDGAILGTSASDVSNFCNNSDVLVTCLKRERDACPEAPYVMKKLGLDLETLSKGLDTLCRQQEVYLTSLECFGKQTRGVEKCQEDHGLTLMRLISRTKTQSNITQHAFLNQFCLARVQYIKCDLQAWAAKPDEACNAPALALKRDLHCIQVPRECFDILSGPIGKVCTYNWVAASLDSADDTNKSGGSRLSAQRNFREFGFVLVWVGVLVVGVFV